MTSSSVRLTVDSVVQYQGEVWRIVHVVDFNRILGARVRDGYLDFMEVSEIKSVTHQSVNSPEISPSQPVQASEPDSLPTKNRRHIVVRTLRPLNYKTSDHKQLDRLVEQHQDIFSVINLPRDQRKQAVVAFAEKYDISVPTAYRRIQLVKTHGVADVLQRSIRSDKGKRRLGKETLKLIRQMLLDHRAKAERKTLERVTVLINSKLRKKNLKPVSIETVRSVEMEKSLKERLKEQGRHKEAKQLYTESIGHLPGNDYPLAIVQIDHTDLQVIFVDEVDREPIGPAWLSLVIDTYSRMVLGFYLSFDGPSALAAGVALSHAILPKERQLNKLGVEGSWPCWGFPDIVHVDNGADLNGLMMHSARKEFMFDIMDRPVGSPNLGGTIESSFRTFIRKNKEIPGTKFSNIFEKAEYDSMGRAVMTLAEFEVLFTEFIVNDYHLKSHGGHDMDDMSPFRKWQLGIFEGDKRPPRGLPERPTDELWIKLNLLPFKKRTIQDGTVALFSGNYYNGALRQVVLDIDPTVPKEQREQLVRYDPRDITKVWLFREKTRSYIELTRTDNQPPISLWEFKARRRRRGQLPLEDEEKRAQSIERQDQLQATSAKKTKTARKQRQREVERRRNAITMQTAPPKQVAPDTDVDDQLTEEEIQAMLSRIRLTRPPPKEK